MRKSKISSQAQVDVIGARRFLWKLEVVKLNE